MCLEGSIEAKEVYIVLFEKCLDGSLQKLPDNKCQPNNNESCRNFTFNDLPTTCFKVINYLRLRK
jgi:hypothetical protein